MYALISTLDAELFCFEYINELYTDNHYFNIEYQACERSAIGKYFRHNGYLFRNNKLFIPNCSLRDFLVRKSIEDS